MTEKTTHDELNDFTRSASVTSRENAEGLKAPSPRQVAEHGKARERAKSRRPALPVKIEAAANNGLNVAQTVSDSRLYADRLLDTCGTTDSHWMDHILRVLAASGTTALGGHDEAVKAGLAFMNGLGPRDEVEAAVGSQMFAVHVIALRMAARAEQQSHPEMMSLMYGQFNKLTRTFTAQVEALAKLRSGGKQTVEVKYVDARNSQNIIAETVNAGGGGTTKIPGQPHAQGLEYQPGAPVAALLCENAVGEAMPSPGNA